MKFKYLAVCFWFLTLINLRVIAQNNTCIIETIQNNNISIVEANDIICLAKSTIKNKIFLYTFGMWCVPCIKHLPNAINLSETHNLEMFILLIDRENESELLERTVKYLRGKKSDINILLLKDYKNKSRNGKYIRFLKEITPKEFENINDMSKYILYNKKGEVILITSWKDNRNNDWQDDSKMIKEIIIPVLKNN